MQITSIKIENFKSIREIGFDLKKYGGSYTTMLVGINESGKSNILEAISYFDSPESEFDYNVIHNQKDSENNPVNIQFSLSFENKNTYVDEVKKDIKDGELLDFEIEKIVKNICLQDGGDSFFEDYDFEIERLTSGLFINHTREVTTNVQGRPATVDVYTLGKEDDETGAFQRLTKELFKELFGEKIKRIIEKYEPSVSLWTPSEKFLVSEVDLNEFKEDIDSNIPLKHIFYIAGFSDDKKIKSEIERASNDASRRKLGGILGRKTTEYIKSKWNHDIIIDIEITDGGTRCVVHVRDGGKANEFNYHQMTSRSEGFKQFVSLILSLSVETKFSSKKNNLILIDEPEIHLHPSGIRDLKKELLSIGESNYLFVSTHSPFLIDRKDKERNIIIKKNKFASTEKIVIDKNTNIIDDEVLREAFGIEVYKDLLNSHNILVEGAADKKILQKAFLVKGCENYGITNGHGSNIDTLASKLNDTDIPILIILDDDKDGKDYKDKIIKIGGSYSRDNVVTIRDLVGALIDGGTIEDTLGNGYVEKKVRETYRGLFGGTCGLTLMDQSPFMEQIKVFLQRDGKNSKVTTDKFFEDLKSRLSNDFNPKKGAFSRDYPLLEALVVAIQSKLR